MTFEIVLLTAHVSARLDVSTARVVRDAFTNEEQCSVNRIAWGWRVFHFNDTTTMPRNSFTEIQQSLNHTPHLFVNPLIYTYHELHD